MFGDLYNIDVKKVIMLKKDPEETVGNRFTVRKLNSNQGFVSECPHFCFKRQLHSSDCGLKNDPKLRTHECRTLSKNSLCKLEANLDKEKTTFITCSSTSCSENSFARTARTPGNLFIRDFLNSKIDSKAPPS